MGEAEVRPGELVVDIGAGTGVITTALAAAGARVIAVELDPGLVRELRARLEGRGVTVIEADALAWCWPRERFRLVANLPFARSGQLLMHLLGDPRTPLDRAHLIVQWELAAKQTAVWPSTLKSTYWGSWYELAISRRVARTAFSPTPSVDAAVLQATRRRVPLVPAENGQTYWRFLARAYREPSGLSACFSRLELKRLAPTLGFEPSAKPRDLDARQWAGLFAAAGRVR